MKKQDADQESSWNNARLIAAAALHVPSTLQAVIRNSWSGLWGADDFCRALGFCAIDMKCFGRAAGLPTTASAADLRTALDRLGIRQAAAILGIQWACKRSLRGAPQMRVWQKLLEEAMCDVQVGSRVGGTSYEIGVETGMLAGFSIRAGELTLMAHDAEAFNKAMRGANSSAERDERAMAAFGCTAGQIGALALQQLGFGSAAANGALLAAMPNAGLCKMTEEVEFWTAACAFVRSVAEHGTAPGGARFSELFPSLTETVRERGDEFFREIALARHDSRAVTWHLPAESYQATEEMLAPKRGPKRYKTQSDRAVTVEPSGSPNSILSKL